MPMPGASWGRYPRATQQIIPLHWRDAALPPGLPQTAARKIMVSR